jgi:hypothetical protein
MILSKRESDLKRQAADAFRKQEYQNAVVLYRGIFLDDMYLCIIIFLHYE